jgi:hypothetical protein
MHKCTLWVIVRRAETLKEKSRTCQERGVANVRFSSRAVQLYNREYNTASLYYGCRASVRCCIIVWYFTTQLLCSFTLMILGRRACLKEGVRGVPVADVARASAAAAVRLGDVLLYDAAQVDGLGCPRVCGGRGRRRQARQRRHLDATGRHARARTKEGTRVPCSPRCCRWDC